MDQNDNYDEKLLGEFIIDALEIINEIEEICLAIANNAQHFFQAKRDLMQKIHSLKGASGMFGLHQIEAWMHKIENGLTQLADQEEISELQLDQIFKGIDHTRKVLNLDTIQEAPINNDFPEKSSTEQESETLLLIGDNSILNDIQITSYQLNIVTCSTISEAINFLEKSSAKAIIIDPKFSRGINYIQLREYFLTRKKIPTLLLDRNKSYLNLLEDEHISAPENKKNEDIKRVIYKFIDSVHQN